MDLNGENGRLNAQITSLQNEISQLENQLNDLVSVLDEIEKDRLTLNSLKDELVDLEKDLKVREKELSDDKSKNEDLSKKLEEYKKDLKESTEFLRDKKDKEEKDLKDLKEKLDKNKLLYEEKIASLKKSIDEDTYTINSNKKTIPEIKKELEEGINPVYNVISTSSLGQIEHIFNITKRIDSEFFAIPFLILLIFGFGLFEFLLRKEEITDFTTSGKTKAIKLIISLLLSLICSIFISYLIQIFLFNLNGGSKLLNYSKITLSFHLLISLIPLISIILAIFINTRKKDFKKNFMKRISLDFLSLTLFCLSLTASLIFAILSKDSIKLGPNYQYSKIISPDSFIDISKESEKNTQILNYFLDSVANTKSRMDYRADSVNISKAGYPNIDANIFVFENDNDANKFFSMGIEDFKLKDNEIAISSGAANLMDLNIADEIYVINSKNKTGKFKIKYIYTNYIGNYLVINKDGLEKNLKDTYSLKKAVNLKDTSDFAIKNYLDRISKYDFLGAVTTSEILQGKVEEQIKPFLDLYDFYILFICFALSIFVIVKSNRIYKGRENIEKLSIKMILSAILSSFLAYCLIKLKFRVKTYDNINLVKDLNPLNFIMPIIFVSAFLGIVIPIIKARHEKNT